MCALRLVGRGVSFVSAFSLVKKDPRFVMRVSDWPKDVSVYCEDVKAKYPTFFLEDRYSLHEWQPTTEEVLSNSWEVWELENE